MLRSAWHVVARMIAFATYGLAAASLGCVVLPLLRLEGRLRRRSDDPEVRAQWVIHRTTDAQLRLVEWLGHARITGHGVERLRERPLLIVANHPSLYDTPVLTRFLPQADFIVSAGWSRNPFLRGAVKLGGYLQAERGAPALRDAVRRLRSGRTLVIYPEGSRSAPDGLLPFQRGAAHIALHAGCDIVPVVIRVTPRTLMKGQRLIDVPAERAEWRVEVGEPIHPADHHHPGESKAQATRRITAALQDHFEKRWDRGSC